MIQGDTQRESRSGKGESHSIVYVIVGLSTLCRAEWLIPLLHCSTRDKSPRSLCIVRPRTNDSRAPFYLNCRAGRARNTNKYKSEADAQIPASLLFPHNDNCFSSFIACITQMWTGAQLITMPFRATSPRSGYYEHVFFCTCFRYL